jgi:DNA topoisomerase-1
MEQDGTPFQARLVKYKGDKIDRLTIGDGKSAEAAKKAVEEGRFSVVSVETKPAMRNPPPPFTTSTLQQEAARKLGFSASHTMRIAQGLYEDGAITYMRTDGVQMDGDAIQEARKAVAIAMTAATCRTSRASIPPRPRTRRKRTRRSARPTSRRTRPGAAIMPGSTT